MKGFRIVFRKGSRVVSYNNVLDLHTYIPQGVHLLLALCLGDINDALVPPRTAHVGQPDPRVAGRSLDDRTAGLKKALLFGVADEVLGGAVFDGTAGVHPLRLGQDLAPGLVAEASQAHQRGVSARRPFLFFAKY